jgi:Ca-activated chloride channel family protein
VISLAWPWLLAALPLPWLAARLLPAADEAGDAVRVPGGDLATLAGSGRSRAGARLGVRGLFALLAWCALVLAAARPQVVGEAVSLPVSGRDLMLAVDLSGSMDARDFQVRGAWVDRLTATKAVASEFIDRRVGDRIGLILFGRQAYLQAPLTFDRTTVNTLLLESAIGLAGKETAIGDAIGLAVKTLSEPESDEGGDRVVILLTDGANTAGEIEPLRAARLAAERDIRIYTIGIGAERTLSGSLFGSLRRNPAADLDEATLTRIADLTGGRYFRARDTGELEGIYAALDELEPAESEEAGYQPVRELYPWPAAAALALGALALIATPGGLRRG